MSGYIGNIPTPQATQSRQSFTATAGQTTFATAGYTAGFLDVYLNGVHLLDGTDYTATNGSDIVLTVGAALDDVVECVAYETFEVANVATPAQGVLADSAVQPNDSPTFAGLTTTANVSFGDNDKALFGDGDDLQIYHNGGNSYIEDVGTGDLVIKAGNLRMQNADGTAQYILADNGGAVQLRYNGGTKLATTSTGINVTGTVSATSFAGDGSSITGVLRKGPDIGAGVDLNTYTTDGYYHQNANSSAGSGTNYPVSLAGMLTVVADGSMVYQTYHTYNGSGVYQRTKYTSSWYAWDKVFDSGNQTYGAGAVGTYAHVATWSSTAHNVGDTVAGSSLFTWEGYSTSNRSAGQTFTFGGMTHTHGFSGTWRWMSAGVITSSRTRMGLAVRIS